MIEIVLMPRTIHRASPNWEAERAHRWCTSGCGLTGRDPELVSDLDLWGLLLTGRRLCGHRTCFAGEYP